MQPSDPTPPDTRRTSVWNVLPWLRLSRLAALRRGTLKPVDRSPWRPPSSPQASCSSMVYRVPGNERGRDKATHEMPALGHSLQVGCHGQSSRCPLCCVSDQNCAASQHVAMGHYRLRHTAPRGRAKLAKPYSDDAFRSIRRWTGERWGAALAMFDIMHPLQPFGDAEELVAAVARPITAMAAKRAMRSSILSPIAKCRIPCLLLVAGSGTRVHNKG